MKENTEQIKLSRTKNTARNLIAGIINKFVTLLLPFLVRTAFIKTIGIEYAGLNSLFTSILQVLNLTELGFSTAVVYSLYKPIADNDRETICALLSFYRKAYFIIGIIVLGAGTALSPFLDYLIKGEIPRDINIHILYFVYLINTSIGYLFFGYKQALFNAYQRQDVLSNIMTLTRGTMNIFQIIVLLCFRNYYGYVLLMPLFTFLNNLLTSIACKKYYPEYKPFGVISEANKRDIKEKIAGLMVSRICQVTRNTFDSIFISAFLGLSITAMYNNYYMILEAVMGFLGIISSSMLAGVGNSIQTENVEKNWNDLKKFNFMYMWVSGWCGSCLLCLYQPFMKIWMGSEYMFPFAVVILLVVYFLLMKTGDITAMYYNATGIWWQNRWRYIIEAIANPILNFLFVKLWGVYGIILATILSILFIGHILGNQMLFKLYFKNGKFWNFLITIEMRYFIIACFIALVTYFCTELFYHFVTVNDYLKLLINAMICLFIPNLLYYGLFFKTKVFNESKQLMLRLILRRK